tara:strand:+ start:186 stop:434 length:249 start_codon:yes stop_codon:yes gene_type:complete
MKDREEIYNEVIQEYSELTYFPKRNDNYYDTIQDVVSNLTDLVMDYGDIVYEVINLNDYSLEELMDKEYCEDLILWYTKMVY